MKSQKVAELNERAVGAACPCCVLVLGVGLGSETFVSELLAHQVKLVVMDKDPQLSSALVSQYQGTGLLTVIEQDFAHLDLVEKVIATYGITHTLAMPVGRALTYLGEINQRHNFLGPRLTPIAVCTNKFDFDQMLEQSGLNDRDYLCLPQRTGDERALSKNELSDITKRFSFPVVVKPCFGSGSMGVWLCHNNEELQAYRVPGRFATQPLLVEEEAEGREYLVNLFIDAKGKIQLLGLYAKEMSPAPFRQEIAYYSGDFKEAYKALRLGLEHMVMSLGSGVCNSFMQCDVFLSEDGKVSPVDVSPRLTGNAIVLLQRFCGHSPIVTYVQEVLRLGPEAEQKDEIRAEDDLERAVQPNAVLRFFSFAREGTVSGFKLKLTPEEQSHIVCLENNIKVGTKVGPMTDGTGLALGYIMVAHEDLAEADRISKAYIDSFELE